MKKRLFLYTISIVCAGLLCFFAASVYVTYTNNLGFAKDTVTEIAQIYADLYAQSTGTDLASLVKAGDRARITVISAEGAVLADSRPLDIGAVENHMNRPEVQAALRDEPAAQVRHSDTLGTDLIYYALKVSSGNSHVFVRAAIPVAQVDGYVWRSVPLLLLVLILVVIPCFFFASRMARSAIEPLDSVHQKLQALAKGEVHATAVTQRYEEVERMTRDIDDVATLLRYNMETLRSEKCKLDYILDNIGDGLVAVDEMGDIALVNTGALRIFGATADVMGKKLSYLTYDKTLTQAVEDCNSSGQSALFELALGGSTYLVTVKRLPDTRLTMAVLSDVTENRESAKRREEFFANASHELKTPLTAIKGFGELAALHNTDEHLRKYLSGIARETDRMLSLIGDMLKLSELENTRDFLPVPVPLSKTVDEVRQTLSAVIEEKGIAFEAVGDGTVCAEPGHVYELVKNLIENAVRYNNPGGSVRVSIVGDKDAVRLTVADTGIGISPAEQSRIFERFYRVEKSRSQQGGGTGLGLSIVKHICALYDWDLSLKSKPGVGTEISVLLHGKR